MTAKNAGVKNADALSVNIKYMINYAGNCLTNQHSDINKAHEILADDTKCEFILGIDTVLCDSLEYADIILPDLFRFEQTSQIATGSDWGYVITGTAATSPKFERKTAYEMACLLYTSIPEPGEDGGREISPFLRLFPTLSPCARPWLGASETV